MLLLLLLLPVAEVISLNPLCDQSKTHPLANVDVPADYIFLFDRGLTQDKSEQWRYVVKAMTCNLMEHTDVKLAVAEQKGDIITFDQWEKPSNFEARLLAIKGNSTGNGPTCPSASSLAGLPLEPNRLTHLVVLTDTTHPDDCDLDSDFDRVFLNSATEVALDRAHVGPDKPSRYVKITQHWEDIDILVSTLPDDHSFANLSNQDTHESLQEQITNWIGGRVSPVNTTTTTGALPWRRSIKEPTTTVADNGTEAGNVTAGTDYNTPAAGNLTTIEMVTVASTVTRNMTAETLETTAGITVDNTTQAGTTILNQNVTIIGLMTNETASTATTDNGTTAMTEEGPAAMAILGEEGQNSTEGATTDNGMDTTTNSSGILNVSVEPPPVMKAGPDDGATSSSTNKEKDEGLMAKAWLWITQEWQLLLWLLLAAILLLCVILLCCCLICVGRKKRKEQRKKRYLLLNGDMFMAGQREQGSLPSSPSSSNSDTCVVPVPEPEQQSLINKDTVSMDTTQVHTNVARKDLQPPSTLPLSSQPPSSEVPDEPSTLPVPHPAEGATDPYSPALPSPFEVRHSEVAVTPVRTVTSFAQRRPQPAQPQVPLLQKKATSPKRNDVFDL